MKTDRVEVALTVLKNGRPFTRGWYDDGDAESGPMGGTTLGFRWGQLVMEEARNGSISIFREGTSWWLLIYSSVSGSTDPRVKKIVDTFRSHKAA